MDRKKLNRRIFLIILLWGILVAVVALLYFLSSQNGKETYELSKSISEYLSRLFYNNVSLNQVNEINRVIRKLAHFFIYFVLSVLFFACLKYTFLHQKQKLNIIINMIVLVSISFIAFYDEWHKQFIPGRHKSVSEALLNIGGCIAGLFIMNTICIIKNHKRKKQFL